MNNIFGQPINVPCYDYNNPQQDPIYDRGHHNPCHCEHHHEEHHDAPVSGCPQLPGTLIRINIPAGTTINILNLFEITSPSGICLIVRLPFLAGQCGPDPMNLVNTLRQSGANVEFING
jgi:hypothetical protein